MKNNKNFIRTFIIVLVAGVTFSCDKYLEEDLRDALSPSTFYNNDNEATIAVNGGYALLTGAQGMRSRNWTQMWQKGTDESSSNRGVYKEGHNYTYTELSLIHI